MSGGGNPWLILAVGLISGAWAGALIARTGGSFSRCAIYKFKLPPDLDCHGIIVVVARSVAHARQVVAEYAVSDEACKANAGHALWQRWFHEHEPTVYPVGRVGVVAWTEFLKG